MKTVLSLFSLVLFFFPKIGFTQIDSKETLQWVENQSGKIDTLLNDAVQSPDQTSMIIKLVDAYLIFEAITLASLYCSEVRVAAHIGRNQTDILNNRLEKDMNSIYVRAIQARSEAQKMRSAAQECRNAASEFPPVETFLPADIIREDAHIVELELSDGLAVNDLHILYQKLEHTIQVLHEMEHLALTLSDCSKVAETAAKTILLCEAALAGRNWIEVKKSVEEALVLTKSIATLSCK